MLEERKKILEKICKLLNLSESSSHKGEKETSKKLASKLMAEFEIKEGDLNKDKNRIMIHVYTNSSRINNKEFSLYDVISEYCGVALYSQKLIPIRSYLFYGFENDIDATLYMISNIGPQIENILKKRKSTHPYESTKLRNNYHSGLIHGLKTYFDEINNGVFKYKQERGLVPINQNIVNLQKAIEEFNRDNDVNDIKMKVKIGEAFKKGMEDSKEIKLRPAIHDDKKEEILYLE